MLLISAYVKMFKSIEDSNIVKIDKDITVLVGQNESGKTAFLQALHKANSVKNQVSFSVTEDYPRRSFTTYERRHTENPDIVVELIYFLLKDEVDAINNDVGFIVISPDFTFKHVHKYNNTTNVIIEVAEREYTNQIIKNSKLPSEIINSAKGIENIRELITFLEEQDLNSESDSFLSNLKSRFTPKGNEWHDLLACYIYRNHITSKVPKFLYFDEYYLLPGKINLNQLQQRVSSNRQRGISLEPEDQTVLSLLQLAGVELDDIIQSSGYEHIKARLEGISNTITDKMFEFWTQNQELNVEFDIRSDPNDSIPFNNGNNLYIRIKNQKHRVTVPFSQRSKGFIWFFSFIVWFDSIKDYISTNSNLILLLDEPGLNLHALAQADFLRYIDRLAEEHQIIYTTHSPFMVNSDRLHQVRTVEDKPKLGTKVSDEVMGSDQKTLFPLQAALGYTIAQNLFIGRKNLLVEGEGDLVYIKIFSSLIEERNGDYLRDDIVVTPVGGVDKIATFVALLGANELEIVVLHDYNKQPDQRLTEIIRERIIQDKNVINYAMFRDPTTSTKVKANTKNDNVTNLLDSDVEDLISTRFYLRIFNSTYSKQLGDNVVEEKDLPKRDRIVERINAYIKDKNIVLRQNGGFNHYLVPKHLLLNPELLSEIDEETVSRFESLFRHINRLFKK